ncbi:MAG TPA: AAA family ATPase, partial [Clostridiales bacterium]|nr:AAA family ATPase [Clostridiales bacterium]
GPPGTGKTTVADIVAKRCNKLFYRINATVASLSDVRDILGQSETLIGSDGILLYIDEIQYFNKKQQQSLLEYVEDGRVTLICSTTENPY